MEAIVLAGGLGTRLREVVPNLPKPMAPICGKPFLEILLSRLAQKGFTRVVLSVGHLSEIISDHFGDSFAGIRLTYVKEDKPLGTGGAVRLALSSCTAEHIYVFNGDTFLDLEVEETEKLWNTFGKPIIVSREVPDTTRYGRILTSGKNISVFAEKNQSGHGLINAGCYIFHKSQLNDFPIGEAFSLESDYLQREVGKVEFINFTTKGKFIDIGIPTDFNRAQTELSEFTT